MSSIFISYRREDSKWATGRIFDHLAARFGKAEIFMDTDAIEPGEDFVSRIQDAIQKAELQIVIIGDRWLGITDQEGKPRLADEQDFVRLEIATALQRDKRVIPILIDTAKMPGEKELPENLIPLARRHAMRISSENFRQDVFTLVATLEKFLNKSFQAVIAGQWIDFYTGTTTFFKQDNAEVKGYYDLGFHSKQGTYRGRIKGNDAELQLYGMGDNSGFMGNAKVSLSSDGKSIAGAWWDRYFSEEPNPILLNYVSDEMPLWLTEQDFDNLR